MNSWSTVHKGNFNKLRIQTTSFFLIALALLANSVAQAGQCDDKRTIKADVVALDMPLMFNRLGAQNINGMMYALKRDVVSLLDETGAGGMPDGQPDYTPLTQISGGLSSYAGNVALRPDKRPRPLVLRTGAGDCLEITLTNLLATPANPFNPANGPVQRSNVDFNIHNDNQVAARRISLRFQGTELVNGIGDDGTLVGENGTFGALIAPGETQTYTVFTPFDGAYLGVSYGGVVGGEGQGGTTASGLWAVLNVNAEGASFYRSQVTNEELTLVSNGTTPGGQPVIDYEATYPNEEPWISEGKAGLPVLNMIRNTSYVDDGGTADPADDVAISEGELVHTAIDAIVAYGPEFELAYAGSGGYSGYLGHFPPDVYPLESVGKRNPTVPNRLEPFRELTVAFHDETQTTQVFPKWYNDPVLGHTLHGVRDSFMINYGSGGIGSEIIANRLGVGPMHDCVNCAYEEFFLTFHTVGEVGQVTDIPANMGLEDCDPTLANCGATGPKANYVLYPEDPSNVHHGYVGDATAFRNLHAGPGEQHVFHLHNHQWLFNADDDNSNYIDAQGLGPGSGYGYWINFGGSGNRNKTAGDAIFHCHFYPHFAQGMWEMWRIHDTFEPGTELQVTADSTLMSGFHEPFTMDGLGIGNGLPAVNSRALPDAEIVRGAPTPAVIPLPGKALPPMPATGVTVVANTNTVDACFIGGDPNNDQVLKESATGLCPAGSSLAPRPVGSLTSVDRSTVLGADLAVGGAGADADVNPGYPFWIAGMEHTIGNRPPTPPLDMITFNEAQQLTGDLWSHPGWADQNAIDGWDGGLPRFAVEGVSAGGEALIALSRLDLSKEIHQVKPVFFPEEGTDLEQVAMAFHAERCHDTYRVAKDGTVSQAFCEVDPNPDRDPSQDGLLTHGGFLTNGALPIAGAPFQDPCIDDRGVSTSTSDGWFFDGLSTAPIWSTAAMGTRGSSPYNATTPRIYKAANVQFDAVLNKLGYHFPQQRIITLWQDVVPTIRQERPPEPFVLRMNTFDCTQYVHSNVVPKVYELDDYQVRTPTDIIGQHIHLPKWDLTSADGSANGWNYEDGTLSPEAVVEIIHAINNWQDAQLPEDKVTLDVMGNPVTNSAGDILSNDPYTHLTPLDHPFFGTTEFAAQWVGARSTLQRWFADPVVNVDGVDRGLGIIFTHDHYGPSTHQQVGLYATVLIEPAGSEWRHNETGTELYTRTGNMDPAFNDGGPTSWQAAILTGVNSDYSMANVKADQIDSFREFYFEYTDFQHAYQPDVWVGVEYDENFNWTPSEGPYVPVDANGDHIIDNPRTGQGPDTFRDATQPPVRKQASEDPMNPSDFPLDIWEFPPVCPGDGAPDGNGGFLSVPRPCPEAITADDPGMYVVNYRNESLLARIYDPDRPGPDAALTQDCSNPADRTGCGSQAEGKAGDLAFAMDSTVTRVIPELNTVSGNAPAGYFDGMCSNGVFCPPINDPAALAGRDPFTPMMRVMDGDEVKTKMQAGGQEEEHTATLYGLRWLQGGSGFGEALNSGWRNAQAAGISEQFSLKMPIYADYNQRGNQADYLYSFNTSIDGWASGTWGLLRSYKAGGHGGLYQLPDNPLANGIRLGNSRDFDMVCPKDAYVREYDITAVSVNDVTTTPENVTIQDLFASYHVGAAPDANGGSLVYNTRTAMVAGTDEGARGGYGPLHDPTAIVYVQTADLVALDAHGHEVREIKLQKKGKGGFAYEAWGLVDDGYGNMNYEMVHDIVASDWNGIDDRCYYETNGNISYEPFRSDCPVRLRYDAPMEPLVVRANAGDCVEATLRNKVLSPATYTDANGTHRVYRGSDVNSPAFFASPGYTYTADVNDNGSSLVPVPAESISWDQTLDLANGNPYIAMIRRDPGQGAQGMTSFNNNLIQPSAHVGLYAQLLEMDVTRNYGMNVGQNGGTQTVVPGGQKTYQWYAGQIGLQIGAGKRGPEGIFVATPIEFGGFNIMPADPIEQGQKGLYGAGAIYPQGSTWTVDAGGTTSATVSGSGYTFRDFSNVAAKGVSLYYADTWPVENILGEGSFGVGEDAQDMGAMAINYGNEAMWFRFGRNPTEAAGNAKCGGGDPSECLGGVPTEDAMLAFHNTLNGINEDPQTAVFTANAGEEYRMHVLMPFGPGRGSTFDLHGHVWQRDPYICPGEAELGLAGKCENGNGTPYDGSVGSRALGINPAKFYLGGIESWFPGQHYEIFIPSAGGTNGIAGDYLFRDHMGLGNTGGLWGILRLGE